MQASLNGCPDGFLLQVKSMRSQLLHVIVMYDVKVQK